MSKLYKSKKGQLIVYIPSNVTAALGLKEGDDVDFFKFDDKSFLVAKKSDIVSMLTHKMPAAPAAPAQTARPAGQQPSGITADELAVLKKLDTIKYNDRTAEKLKQVLNQKERATLKELIKRKWVSPFKKAGEQQSRYGIAKNIYNQYLYGKREVKILAPVPAAAPSQAPKTQPQVETKTWEKKIVEGEGGHRDMLEANGFLVISNQAEASAVSAELEESIRRGLVIGTRAFNKKYYITLKSFVNKNSTKILKAMGQKGTPVSDISKATGIDEEGVRAILYMLAESGEVSETRRDIFKLV